MDLQGQSRLLACCALLLAPIVGREHLFDLNKFPYEVASQFLVEQELVGKRLFCGPKTLQAFSKVDVSKRYGIPLSFPHRFVLAKGNDAWSPSSSVMRFQQVNWT